MNRSSLHDGFKNTSRFPDRISSHTVLRDDGREEENPVPPLEDPSIPSPESWRRGDPCYPIFLNLPRGRSFMI